MNSLVGQLLKGARRNPVSLMLLAAGAGLLVYEMTRGRSRRASSEDIEEEAAEIPVLNTGQARVYDPDAPTLHRPQDALLSGREMSAQV